MAPPLATLLPNSHTGLEDGRDIAEGRYVCGRITVEGDEVRHLALLNGSDLVGQADRLGRDSGGRDEGLTDQIGTIEKMKEIAAWM